MKIRLVFTFTFVLSVLLVFSQHALPPKGELFRDNVVPSIYVTLLADSLAEILDYDNRLSDYHYHASFVFDNGVLRDSLAVVGFRLRGNTSRKSQKKSFKISFNEYVSGQKYQGLEKLNINGEHNDPSLSRAKYCFDFLDYLEVPASRTNHVRLYINGDYFGLYLNVEHYDEEFTKSRFNGNGNLYKCTYGADLQYRGATGNSYKLDYYEIKNPDGPNGYEDLAQFITVLNNTPSSDFECEIEQIFNVNSYLKCLVMDVLSGNWDGPNYNKNNFYLYFNTHSDQFEYIPYDLDNTLGVDFLGVEWSDRNIYNWSKSNANRPLFTKIMARETYRNRFNYFLNKALSEYFNPTLAYDRFNDIRLLIGDAAKADTIRMLDYGYTWSDFNSSFGYFSKDHVKYGIQDFVTRRYNSAVSQLQTLETTGGIPLWHAAVLNAVGDSITYTIRVEEEESLESVVVNYNWEYQSAMWVDTLDVLDSVNHLYSKTIAWHPTLKQVAYSFTLNGSTISTEYPVCDMFSLVKPSNDIKLYINELMADNSTTKMDGDGEYEDWIEVFYNGDSPINIGGYYLTDNLSNPFKYKLPATTMLPGGFKLIWADDEVGADHANFKLSKSGEILALFDAAGSLIDSISFMEQSKDVSLGRAKDGDPNWISFAESTPGYSNTGFSRIDELQSQVSVYPNPSSSRVYITANSPIEELWLIDMQGKMQDVQWNKQFLNISALPAGVYFLNARLGAKLIHYKIVKVN